MANNFKITVRRKDSCLHLRLIGHFDGSSAYQLIHLLQTICRGLSKVYIHTDGIKHVHPFGKNTFGKNLHLLAGKAVSIVLTGEKAEQIIPELIRENVGISLSII